MCMVTVIPTAGPLALKATATNHGRAPAATDALKVSRRRSSGGDVDRPDERGTWIGVNDADWSRARLQRQLGVVREPRTMDGARG